MGEVATDRFISIAEDCGLVAAVTDQLLAQACRHASTWSPKIDLTFNISPVLLRDASLPDRVLRILAAAGLPPQRLELEITESALVRDLGAAQAVLGALREAGLRMSVDDFGTGHSSLYHLAISSSIRSK